MTKATCAYFNCRNNIHTSKNITYFSFPIRDEAKCKEWQKNCGNGEIAAMDISLLAKKKICEKHFASMDVYLSNRRKLVQRVAVPIPYKPQDTDLNSELFENVENDEDDNVSDCHLINEQPAKKYRISKICLNSSTERHNQLVESQGIRDLPFKEPDRGPILVNGLSPQTINSIYRSKAKSMRRLQVARKKASQSSEMLHNVSTQLQNICDQFKNDEHDYFNSLLVPKVNKTYSRNEVDSPREYEAKNKISKSSEMLDNVLTQLHNICEQIQNFEEDNYNVEPILTKENLNIDKHCSNYSKDPILISADEYSICSVSSEELDTDEPYSKITKQEVINIDENNVHLISIKEELNIDKDYSNVDQESVLKIDERVLTEYIREEDIQIKEEDTSLPSPHITQICTI